MPSEQEQRIFSIFIEEAQEHLNTLENGLVDLKATMGDPEKVNEMFRAAHSVKGGAAMLVSMSPSLESVRKTAHRLEDCFKIIRENRVNIDQTVEDQFLKGYDVLKALVEKIQSPYGLREEEGKQMVEGALPLFALLEKNLNSLVGGGKTTPLAAAAKAVKVPANFAAQVKAGLKQMLQLFKETESTESRKKLLAFCNNLMKLGPGIESWATLLKTTQGAIANPKAPYKLLAPVIIKELNQAADLIQGGKASEVAPSKDLQKLVPAAKAAAAATPVAAATPAPAKAAVATLPKDPKEAVKLLIKTYDKKQLEAMAKLLIQYIKK